MADLGDLQQRVISYIGEVDGTAVQTYSEPRVLEALKQMYFNLFRKRWWPQYMKWYTLTLSGSNGIHTSTAFGDDGGVQKFEDIKIIIPDGCRRGLPRLPNDRNPYDLTGTTPIYHEAIEATDANVARRFRVWPLASTGTLYVQARIRPAMIDVDTESYFDDNLMVYGAGWLILEQEDINANAAATAERMYTETYADVVKAEAELPLENPYSGVRETNYLSDWSRF